MRIKKSKIVTENLSEGGEEEEQEREKGRREHQPPSF